MHSRSGCSVKLKSSSRKKKPQANKSIAYKRKKPIMLQLMMIMITSFGSIFIVMNHVIIDELPEFRTFLHIPCHQGGTHALPNPS